MNFGSTQTLSSHLKINDMKTSLLLGALLVCAAPLCAQPADTPAKLVNDLPFPLVAPEKAQQLVLPNPIVLSFDNVTLGAALDELQKQSGVRFGTSQANFNNQLDTKISGQINTISFDEAFDQIMDEAGLKANLQDWGNGSLHLYFGQAENAGQPQKSGAGLFRINLASLDTNFNKSVDLSNFKAPQRSENRSLSARLALQSDRRLPLIGSPQVRLTRADDDKNRSLVPQPDENERAHNRVNRYSFYSNGSWEQKNANVNLISPAPDAKILAHLEGVVVYAVVSKTEKWEVPDLLSAPQWEHNFASPEGTVALKIAATPGTEDEQGGLKVRIEATSSNDDQSYERVTYPLAQVEPLMAAMRIEDANGVVYRNSGYNANGGPTTKISATFLPENQEVQEGANAQAKGPFRFEMNAPVEIVQTEVPFSFENVPLP